MLIHGLHSVREALRSGRVREIRVADRDDARVREIVDEARLAGVLVRRVARETIDRDARGGRHQGVVAEVRPAPPATLAELAAAGAGPPLIVVLDGVEDPQNIGAVLRAVDAAGGSGVVRQTRRAAALDAAAARASAGAVHHVRVADEVNITRALGELKALGVWCVGLDAEAGTPYHDVDLTVPVALVVGAEGRGLRRLVRERCDLLAAIPMAGRVGSLNVSVAAAVVLFEAVRQRRSRGRP